MPEDRFQRCPLHLHEDDVEKLRRLVAQEETLLAVAKTHSALLMISHIAKWLSAILGALLVLKGFTEW